MVNDDGGREAVRGVGRGRWGNFQSTLGIDPTFVVRLPPFFSFLFESSAYVRRSGRRERNERTR